MKSILLFYILWLPLAGSSQIQIQPEQVFILGEYYMEDKCEAQAYPTWSWLVFLPKNKFYLSIAYGETVKIDRRFSDRQMGNYRIVGDTLFLNFTKAGYDLSSDEYGPNPNRKSRKLMAPKKFLITNCGEKLILRNPAKEFGYGSRDFKSEAALLTKIYHNKFYEKVREELKGE